MATRRLFSLFAVAATIAGGLLIGGKADASIGIVRWRAVGSDPTATINYRLNLGAVSGQIQIINANTQAVIKTIPLTGAQLTDGPHSVLWDGTNEQGISAPTGTYFARITVNRGPVASDPEYGQAFRIRDHTVQEPLTHRYYGIDTDKNPANNNQTDPSLSTFGNIYIANTVTKRVEVWVPGNPDGTDYAANLIGDVTVTPGWPTGLTGGSSPWGLAVSHSGRVFTSDRSQSRLSNYNWDGSDAVISGFQGSGNSRDVAVVGKDPAVDGVVHAAVSSGNKFGGVEVGPGTAYTFDPPLEAYRYPSTSAFYRTLISGIGASENVDGIGFNDYAADPQSAVWYIARSAENWVRRWIPSQGSNFQDLIIQEDTGWELSTTGPTDVAISPKDPNIAIVTKTTSPNIEVWNIATQTLLGTYAIGTGGAAKVSFDPWGNALVVNGTIVGGPWAYLYVLPNNGSSDTRDTITFTHTQGNIPPVVVGATFDPNAIPLDDTTTTTLTIVVRDAQGVGDITSVSVNLSPLGYDANTVATKVADNSATEAVYEVTGIKAKPTSRAGALSLLVTAKDTQNATGTENAILNTTGGTLTGVITHKDGLFPIVGAAVTATDGTNVYNTTSVAGGVYTLQVNPGTFTVSATKNNYGAGDPSSSTDVVLGGSSTPTTDATLGSVNINQVKATSLGSVVCVEAVVSAAGYTPVSEANARPKFYLRDSSGSNNNGLATPTDNLGIRVYAPAADPQPVEGDRVVVEGVVNLFPFEELRVTQVTNFVKLTDGQAYRAPDAGVVNDFNDNRNNLSDARWGNLIKVEGVTVETVNTEASEDWYELTVKDDSSDVAGTVIIWKQTGITAEQIPAVGSVVDITGVISRKESGTLGARTNVLEPRKVSDLLAGEVDAASVGQAKSSSNGTIINFTTPLVVTVSGFPLPGENSEFFYVQDEDGTAGIRVEVTSLPIPNVGDKVLLSGRLATKPTGERVLQNGVFTPAGTGNVVIRNVGSKAFGGPGYVGTEFGLSNQGLLVRVYGKVTKTDFIENVFYLDDGANVDSGDPAPGIKVVGSEYLPFDGDVISIIGAVSAEKIGDKQIRVLRARQGNPFGDLVPLN